LCRERRNFWENTATCDRFLPVKLDGRGVGMLHSRNEAVTVGDYHACVGFYREVIRRFC